MRRVFAGVVIGVASFALVACGSSGSSTTSTSATSSSAAPSSAPASSVPASSPASSAASSEAPAGGQASELADAAYALLDTQGSKPLSEQLKAFADDPATQGIAMGLGLTVAFTAKPPKATLEISGPGVLCTVDVNDTDKTKSSSCSG